MFTIRGFLREPNAPRDPVRITWDSGVLIGDTATVRLAQSHAAGLEGLPVGPPDGPTTETQHLMSPVSAVIILADLFLAESITLEGDVPERAALPAGAVG
jgi:hypothetical protein